MANITKTSVDAGVMERVSATIQSFLIQEAKLIPTVMFQQAQKGEDRIKLTRAAGFTVNSKAADTAVTAQNLTYSADNLDLDQHKTIQVQVEDIANVQFTPDLIQDLIMRMSKEMALDIDKYIVTQLEATSSAAPDHRIAYANATDLKKADLLEARKLLHIQNVPFNECWIGVSPASEVSLLAIDDFVHVDKYGSSEGLVNGELGKLYGARVIMSNEFDDAKTMVWHPSHVAFAMQIAPKFESDRVVEHLADLYSISQLYGATTLDSGKRGVLLGTET